MSTQATGFEPTHSSFQTDRRPTGFEPVLIQRHNNQINPVQQAKGFEPLLLAEMRTLKRALIRPQGLNLCHL